MKNLLIFLGTLLISTSIYGHTCSTKKMKCPIDKEPVLFCVTTSMTTFGSYYDFQKTGATGSHYEELINSCPKCHYSGYVSDFDTTFTIERKEEIKDFLVRYDDMDYIDDGVECLIAGELKEFLGANNDDISNCYLVGSYLVRMDATKKDLRVDLQKRTRKFLIRAIENDEYKDSSMIANINYLIAEMYRRTGDFKESVKYFDKAISDQNKMDWVEEIATKQKDLAIKEDDDNEI